MTVQSLMLASVFGRGDYRIEAYVRGAAGDVRGLACGVCGFLLSLKEERRPEICQELESGE